MKLLDRILTIIITATLTSAVWIVAGGSIMQLAEDKSASEPAPAAEAQPSPAIDQKRDLGPDAAPISSPEAVILPTPSQTPIAPAIAEQ